MNLKQILKQVQSGEMSVDQAESKLSMVPYEDMGFAKLDTNRELRQGFPEVVFCKGKADEYLVEIYKKLYEKTAGYWEQGPTQIRLS